MENLESNRRWTFKINGLLVGMAEVSKEAVLWWNLRLGREDDPYSEPECFDPSDAFLIWPKVCPFLQQLIPAEAEPDRYWRAVMSVISRFVEGVPNPLENFPLFVEKLYEIRGVFAPKNVGEALLLIEKLQTRDLANFVIYKLPSLVQEPLLYFDTMLALHEMNHKLWKTIVVNPSLIDAFFELHDGFIQPLPANASEAAWKHRLHLSETLFLLIRDSSKATGKSATLASKLIDLNVKLLGTAPLEYSGSFLRYTMKLMKSSQKKIPKEQLHSRAVQILLALDRVNSPLLRVALNFLLSLKPAVVSSARIIKMISHRGIRSVLDLEIIGEIAEGPSLLPAVFLLCRTAISEKLWHRACMNEVKGLLVKFSSRADVREWFQLFVRRLFVFVAVAYQKMRYRTRTLMLCETLSSMLNVKLLWLQQSILTAASSIIATKIYPHYFKSFFPVTAPADEVIIHEFESFANNPVPLKLFPFDPVKGSLMLPPLVDLHGHLSQRSLKLNERSSTQASDRNDVRLAFMKRSIHKKRGDPLIKRPSGIKQARPLASAICVMPVHRR